MFVFFCCPVVGPHARSFRAPAHPQPEEFLLDLAAGEREEYYLDQYGKARREGRGTSR